jgi:hypothetical protein
MNNPYYSDSFPSSNQTNKNADSPNYQGFLVNDAANEDSSGIETNINIQDKTRRHNAFSIIGFVLPFVAPYLCLFSLIFSILGVTKGGKNGEKIGLGVAGIVISGLTLTLFLFIGLMVTLEIYYPEALMMQNIKMLLSNVLSFSFHI